MNLYREEFRNWLVSQIGTRIAFVKGSCTECPLAAYIGDPDTIVGTNFVHHYPEGSNKLRCISTPLPQWAARFRREFDYGGYRDSKPVSPELTLRLLEQIG